MSDFFVKFKNINCASIPDIINKIKDLNARNLTDWNIVKIVQKENGLSLLLAFNHPAYRHIGMLRILPGLTKNRIEFVGNKNQKLPAAEEIVFLFSEFLSFLENTFPNIPFLPEMSNWEWQ